MRDTNQAESNGSKVRMQALDRERAIWPDQRRIHFEVHEPKGAVLKSCYDPQ